MPERPDGSGLAATAVPPSPSVHQSEPHKTRRKEPQSPRRPVNEPAAEVEFEDEDLSQQRPARSRRPPTYLNGYACRVVRCQRC